MNRIPLSLCILIILLAIPNSGNAWDGYDYEHGTYIEFLRMGAIIPDHDAEIYDYSDGSYHDVQIVSITRNGTTEIEVYDYDTEYYRSFVMDGTIKPVS